MCPIMVWLCYRVVKINDSYQLQKKKKKKNQLLGVVSGLSTKQNVVRKFKKIIGT